MKTLSNLIDNRQLLDFSQHFNVARPQYLGTQLFPDRKTQYIEQEYTRLCENGNLPTIAMIHADDAEAHIGSRVPFERVRIEELTIKEKINLTEELMKLTRGLSMEQDALRRYIFDDVARMAERVVTRAELAKMEALTKAKLEINENGVKLDVDYGLPDENRVSSDWTDTKADILGDIRKWRNVAIAHGVFPTNAYTTEGVLTNIMTNENIQKQIFGSNDIGRMPTLDEINALFRSQFPGFVSLETYEARYGEIDTNESGNVFVNQKRFFPEDTFVMVSLTNGNIGAGIWGQTAEEIEQGGAFDTKRQQQYVTVTTWETPDPVAVWTKASGLMIPALPNVYGHIIADVSKDETGGTGQTGSTGSTGAEG